MNYNLTLYTAPTTEPLTLDEVKSYLRIDTSDDDVYLWSLLTTARKFCESFQNRVYITQTWEVSFDNWPCSVIELPKGNLQSITHIKYTDSDNVITTIDSGDYVVSTRGMLGKVAPAYGKSWPSFTPCPLDPIVIRYVCGYGTADDVPEQVKQAMYLLISHWYEQRIPISMTNTVSKEIEFTVSALLWQERIMIF
jgi:uncharacterized phiE125 gp8 family phage protein